MITKDHWALNLVQHQFNAFNFVTHKFTKRKINLRIHLFTSIIFIFFYFVSKANAFQFMDDSANRNSQSRVHQVQHLAGETALLPCEVRTNECGSIYFITWSRNTSQEWHRIFIYSRTSQRPFYDTYNQIIKKPNHYNNQSQKLLFDATNLTSDGFAYLRINSVDNDDEGSFRCDVTYVNGKCPSLTYTHLSTIVKPGKPEIKVNGIELTNSQETLQETYRLNGNKHRRLAFEEGSTITLDCSTSGGKPVPFIRWYNGSRPLPGKVALSVDELTVKQKVTSITQFVLSRFDLNSRFYCKVWTNVSSMDPLFGEVSIDVHVKPTKLNIIKPSTPVVAGEMISLTCTVNGARPRATITWFNRSQPVQKTAVENTELMDDGTYRTSSTLVFIATRYDHQAEFFCKGTNDVLKNKNEVPLLQATQFQVLYPPHVWMEPTDSMDVNESQSVSILCKWVSNPSNLSELYFTFSPKNDPVLTQVPISGVVSPPFVLTKSLQFSRNTQFSIVQNGIAELMISNINRNQSGFYGCATRNAFGRSTALKPLQINVQFPPVVSIELIQTSALSDSPNGLRLKCVVLTGQPKRLLKVHWFRNGEHFASTPPGYFFTTNEDLNEEINELVLSNLTDTSFRSNYSCSGYNGINRFGPISAAKAVLIHKDGNMSNHASNLLNTNNYINVVKDNFVKINCTFLNLSKNNYASGLITKDIPTLTKWWFNDEVLTLDTLEPGSDTLIIERASLSNEGNYTCEQFGNARSSVYLKVQAPPRIITGIPSYVTWPAKNKSLTLSCRVECEPKCTISWLINNITLNNDHQTSIAEVIQPLEKEGELFASTISYLRLNNVHSLLPDSEIVCKSNSNGIGSHVKSVSIYKTESPPNSIKTSTEMLELLEGQLLSKQLISCNAIAFPPAFYTWSRQIAGLDHQIELGTNVLSATSLLKKSLNQQLENNIAQQLNVGLIRASREMTGNYSCKATNKLGETEKKVTILVYYRPECNVRKEILTNGKILLTCNAIGSPSSFNFTWLKNNQTLINNRSNMLSLDSISRDNNAILVLSNENDSTLSQYSCIVSNAIGNSDPCHWSFDSQNNSFINAEENLTSNFLSSIFYKSDYLLVFAITSGIFGFLFVCILIVCTVYCILRKRIKAVENVGSKTLNLPASATYGLINGELIARTLNSKFNNYNNTENINYGKTSTLAKNYSEEQCKLALFDEEEKSITDGRSSDYHTYCDADTVRMSSTTKLFHPQNQLTKFSSNNKIYNNKISNSNSTTNNTSHTNSNNSTSPLITKGQQLLLSSNEDDDDEENSQMQLSNKRNACSNQLMHHRSSISQNLFNNQAFLEQKQNYYGQIMAPCTSNNRFTDLQTSYRSQQNLDAYGTLNSNTISDDNHHYYEPMFSSNKIYQKIDLPPLPPERHYPSNIVESGLQLQSLNTGNNFSTLHHPHYMVSNSIQGPALTTNYNTLNLGKHTIIGNLTSSTTNLQHLNQFYSKKKINRN